MGESEPVSCLDILPIEIWELVLENVKSLADLCASYATCKTWQTILFPKVKPTLALHKVLPLLWKYLKRRFHSEYDEIVKCRLVCSKWKEIVDNIFFQEDWDGEVSNRFGVEAYLKYENNTAQGSKVKMGRGNKGHSFFREIVEGRRENPFLSRTLQYESREEEEVGESDENGGDSFSLISMQHGRHLRNLIYHSVGRSGIRENHLTRIFLNFPNLTRLKFIFDMDAGDCYGTPHERKALREVEEKVEVSARSSSAGVRMCNLAELTVSNMEDVLPLPHLLSIIITSSPRLRKVTLVWGNSDPRRERSLYTNDKMHKQHIDILMSSVSSMATVAELVLIGWKASLGFKDILAMKPWPLKILTVRLHSKTSCKKLGPKTVSGFRQIVDKFSSSLEELWIQPPVKICRGHGLLPYEEKWHRSCACNDYLDKFENYKEILEFHQFCAKNRFERLRILGTGHTLLHPALFPGVMSACPNLKELWIYHSLEHKWWEGADDDGPRTEEEVLWEFVSQLWSDTPPSLRLIVVQKWKYTRKNYRFWRSEFGSWTHSSGLSRRLSLWERERVVEEKEKAAKKCLIL